MSEYVKIYEYLRDDSPTGRVYKVWIIDKYHTLREFYLPSEAEAYARSLNVGIGKEIRRYKERKKNRSWW